MENRAQRLGFLQDTRWLLIGADGSGARRDSILRAENKKRHPMFLLSVALIFCRRRWKFN